MLLAKITLQMYKKMNPSATSNIYFFSRKRIYNPDPFRIKNYVINL